MPIDTSILKVALQNLMLEAKRFDQELFDTLDSICKKHERQSIVTATPDDDVLGDFNPIWQYLSQSVSCVSRPKGSPTKLSVQRSISQVELRRSKKRDLRKARRQLAQDAIEARACVPESDEMVPELGAYTSASDIDTSNISSDDDVSEEERLTQLRSILACATKVFQGSSLAPEKRPMLSDKDRAISIRQKIMKRYPETKETALFSPSRSPPRVAFVGKEHSRLIFNSDLGETHIFVDSSNIYLGFQDLLQKLHPTCYPSHSHRKPRMDLHILDTILERGRHSIRKSLVASSPLLQNWDAAVTRDYQLNILERVSSQDKPNQSKEQGVDELLHLQMMESILDHEPGTMVLASGDANVAQFSSGFYQVVLRALSRGWTVEVFGFDKSLNRLWLNGTLKREYKGRYRVIFLDDYIDELEM